MLPLWPPLRHPGGVNDRVARLAVRGLVVAAVAAAMTAEIANHVVLDHGSGTFLALLVFLPLLVLPGALAWQVPSARNIAVWAASGWFSTTAWMAAGAPHWRERELGGWPAISVPLWIAIALVIFVAPLVALVIGKARELPAEVEVFGWRFRRIISITLVFATAVIIATTAHGSEPGYLVGFTIAALVAPGMLAYRDPRPRWAWLWTLWASPLAIVGTWGWLQLRSTHWMIDMVGVGLGTIIVLLLLGLPLICLATPPGPFFGTAARASYRTRS